MPRGCASSHHRQKRWRCSRITSCTICSACKAVNAAIEQNIGYSYLGRLLRCYLSSVPSCRLPPCNVAWPHQQQEDVTSRVPCCAADEWICLYLIPYRYLATCDRTCCRKWTSPVACHAFTVASARMSLPTQSSSIPSCKHNTGRSEPQNQRRQKFLHSHRKTLSVFKICRLRQDEHAHPVRLKSFPTAAKNHDHVADHKRKPEGG